MAKTAENTNEALKRMVRQILYTTDPVIHRLRSAGIIHAGDLVTIDTNGMVRRAAEGFAAVGVTAAETARAFRAVAEAGASSWEFLSPSYPLVPMLSLSILWAIEQADRAREEREEREMLGWAIESEEPLF